MSAETCCLTGMDRGAIESSCFHFRRLRDVEAMAERHGWTTVLRQLEPGSLRLRGSLATTGTATVLEVVASHRLEIRGQVKRDTVALLLPRSGTELWLNGYSLTPNRAMVVPAGGTIAAWSGGGARVLIILAPASSLQCELLFGAEDERSLKAGNSLLARGAGMGDVGDWVRALSCATHGAGALNACSGATGWRPVTNTDRQSRSFPVISRAVDYVDSNLGRTISSAKLSDAAASSLSKLERAFRQELGLTPSAYIRARRLHAARRELQSGRSRQVAAVAFDSGFRHLGRFSGAYRSYFGELPSETLRAFA